jgi:carbonic anhydrase
MSRRSRHLFRPLSRILIGCAMWPGLAAAFDSGPTDLPIHRDKRLHTTAKSARASVDVAMAAPTATGMADPAADPLDRLRQRLAERLAGAKPSEGQASNDLRVVVKTPTAAPQPASQRAAVKTKPLAGKAVAGPDTHSASGAATPISPAHWDYHGDGGPQAWSKLKPEFSLCGNGQRQSPIDIRGGLAVELEPVRFDYQPSRFAVVDNGHTVQVNVQPGNAIEVAGKRFELVQFHLHRPSEERIDGKQFEMSLHLVHKNEQGHLAVVALLIDKGARQAALQKVWNNLPLEKNQEAAARAPLELLDLLPDDRRYFTYMGSLTTPPCSEGVQWIVLRQPVTAAPEQIELFSRLYPMNARPLQAASGRRIMQSQ